MGAEEPRHWFPAKRFGWGWGLPRTWEGWLVTAVYGVVVVAAAALLRPGAMAVVVLVASAALIAVCWVKGERPRWRWGR